jgi:hypothetical protein
MEKTSDAEFDKQFKLAKQAGLAALNEPRAKSAKYSRARRQVVVELTNGCTFMFPVDMAQGLVGASDSELSDVEVLGSGFGLHWEKLDADLSIPSLVVGLFGSQAWMRELARRGGASTSSNKSAAARANGAKGGRPRRTA